MSASAPTPPSGYVEASARPLAAACAFALGTFAAFGAVALYGPGTSPRLALTGSLWTLILPAAGALAYVLVRRPTAREAAPLWLPAIALLPWLPLPIPPAALLWTGPLGARARRRCHRHRDRAARPAVVEAGASAPPYVAVRL